MPFSKPFLRLLVVPLILVSTSCVKDVDLDQDDSLDLVPGLAVDLADFQFTSNYFFDNEGLPIDERSDTLPLVVMDRDLAEKLTSVDLYFSFSNTFGRSFKNQYTFYNATDQILYEVDSLGVGPAPSGSSVFKDTIITVEGATLESLKDAAQLGISLEIGKEPGSTAGELEVKVSAVYNFEFQP